MIHHFSENSTIENIVINIAKELNLQGTVNDFIAVILKTKNSVLDKEVVYVKQNTTYFSGSFHVPNVIETNMYLLANDVDIKEYIADSKKKEKERLKEQRKRSLNHDYRFAKNSEYSYEFKVSTIKKMLKDFTKRKENMRGSFSSVSYNYNFMNEVAKFN